jgi:hypothetical protein
MPSWESTCTASDRASWRSTRQGSFWPHTRIELKNVSAPAGPAPWRQGKISVVVAEQKRNESGLEIVA